MSAKRKPTEGPRPMAVADAHALADRMELAKPALPLYPGELRTAAQLLRALLRGRKASDIIEMD